MSRDAIPRGWAPGASGSAADCTRTKRRIGMTGVWTRQSKHPASGHSPSRRDSPWIRARLCRVPRRGVSGSAAYCTRTKHRIPMTGTRFGSRGYARPRVASAANPQRSRPQRSAGTRFRRFLRSSPVLGSFGSRFSEALLKKAMQNRPCRCDFLMDFFTVCSPFSCFSRAPLL